MSPIADRINDAEQARIPSKKALSDSHKRKDYCDISGINESRISGAGHKSETSDNSFPL